MTAHELNAAAQQNICLLGVREHSEGYPVELARAPTTGRLSIRARNEGGNNETFVDLFELLDYLSLGPQEGRTDAKNGFVLISDEACSRSNGAFYGNCHE